MFGKLETLSLIDPIIFASMDSWLSHNLLDLQAAHPLLDTNTYKLLNLLPYLSCPL